MCPGPDGELGCISALCSASWPGLNQGVLGISYKAQHESYLGASNECARVHAGYLLFVWRERVRLERVSGRSISKRNVVPIFSRAECKCSFAAS